MNDGISNGKIETGFHATRWFAIYDICIHGLKEGRNTKRGKPVVYHCASLDAGTSYHRYHFMPNGCACCAVAHILVDADCTDGAGKGQRVTEQAGVTLDGIFVRGYTQQELEEMKNTSPGSLCLLELWDPSMEVNPWDGDD